MATVLRQKMQCCVSQAVGSALPGLPEQAGPLSAGLRQSLLRVRRHGFVQKLLSLLQGETSVTPIMKHFDTW